MFFKNYFKIEFTTTLKLDPHLPKKFILFTSMKALSKI